MQISSDHGLICRPKSSPCATNSTCCVGKDLNGPSNTQRGLAEVIFLGAVNRATEELNSRFRRCSVNSRDFLVFPFQWKRLHRPRHRQSLRVLARQYRFHDLWCQQCHAQNPADIGRVDVLGIGEGSGSRPRMHFP
ncbi:MAG: hypothetical protein WCJ41_17375, partial [Aestuariivirga sp.]|uniref:hypothetical protein n=1 Tax=Aestuariivirga sp. TaxID=2650926 RepID=UPI0030195582